MSGRLATAIADGAQGAVVETTCGKIRGVRSGKVHAFKGVPYAASTAGANRFMPPRKREPWTGVRDASMIGSRCPQRNSDFHGQVPKEWEVLSLDEPMSEDCLFLNLYTPQPRRGQKRPVMLWLHGGGYTSGSGSFSIYDGTPLAEKQDVVLVSINHRLTIFGFLDLAGIGGEKYAHASNVGMLDIVAALEWVRDNIDAFGGDPQNVTIFGQSGGGGKVSTLLAMPSAKGLFHRAIIQSGANVKGVTREAAANGAETFLAKLNLKPDQVDQLQSLSTDQLLAAIPPGAFGPGALPLAPVVDGWSLPNDPFDPAAPAISADIPVLTGTVEDEVAFFPGQQLDPIDDANLHARIKQIVRKASDAQVGELIAAYKKGRPNAANTDIFLIIMSDATFRSGVVLQADRKADQGRGAVYQYYWTWQSPARDGKLRAFHTIEIPFVFDNVDGAKLMTGDGKDRYALEDKVSGAWAAFARTGNPNHPGLPNWPAFDTTRRATMILDNECQAVNDPYGEEQRMLHSLQNS
jgi:para-nitrobenzyl esterase